MLYHWSEKSMRRPLPTKQLESHSSLINITPSASHLIIDYPRASLPRLFPKISVIKQIYSPQQSPTQHRTSPSPQTHPSTLDRRLRCPSRNNNRLPTRSLRRQIRFRPSHDNSLHTTYTLRAKGTTATKHAGISRETEDRV
jgi:hypothetical protein